MSIFGERNLYDEMLYNYGVRRYMVQPVYMYNEGGQYVLKGELTMPHHFCESTATYLYSMQDVALEKGGYEAGKEIKFFVNAAHVVFVPFGQAGYDFLKKVVAEKCDGKAVGEFLYEKFVERVECPLNGNLLKGLDDEQKEYIKEFFVSFESKDDIDCSQPKDVATLVCRLFFAMDALLKNRRGDIRDLCDKYMKPIEEEIIDFEKEAFSCRLSDFIGRIPAREPLNGEEEKYILDLFGFTEKKKRGKGGKV